MKFYILCMMIFDIFTVKIQDIVKAKLYIEKKIQPREKIFIITVYKVKRLQQKTTKNHSECVQLSNISDSDHYPNSHFLLGARFQGRITNVIDKTPLKS